MKLQLDFNEKTVSVERDVKAGEFVEALKNLLPDWKEWNVKKNTIIDHRYYPYPVWYVNPYYTEWKYFNPDTTGMNDTGTTFYVTNNEDTTGSFTLTTNNTLTSSKIDECLVVDEDHKCYFDVNRMSGIHQVLIN